MNKTDFIKYASNNRGIPARLIREVITQLGGWDEDAEGYLRDIANHGIGGGFRGFTYYTDTVAFAKRNRARILKVCEQMRESCGEPDTLSAFIAGFKCVDLSPREVEAVLMDTGAIVRNDPQGDNAQQVYNGLAWFAAEEVANAYVELEYERSEAPQLKEAP